MINRLNELLRIELQYAHFNALRTCAADNQSGVSLELSKGSPRVLDSGRPASPYYNRAVVSPEFASIDHVLTDLPDEIVAVELQLAQQNSQTFTSLLEAGFVPCDTLCYLSATPVKKSDAVNTVAFDGSVEQLGPDQTDHFFDLLELSGVEFSAEKRDAKREYYCSDTFRCFVAYSSDGEPTAWATMYVGDSVAFLANAYTIPKHREHGSHHALLASRLELAATLGLSRVFTDVVPVSQSHANCRRVGFELLTTNLIWKR